MALCGMTDTQIEEKLGTMPASVTTVTYLNWMAQEICLENRVIKKTKLTRIEESRADFIHNLVGGMSVFRDHCRRVLLQYQETKHLQSQLMPKFEVTVQIDYAENWAVKYQDEIAAVYFDKNQITIHPMVVHYKGVGAECDKICHLSFVGVSSVTAHSVPTTFAFIGALMSELLKLLPELKVVHFISDSPSSQYRNRSMCSLVARFASLYDGIEASWSWLEAGHGKGPCDGIGGGIKKKADNLVKSGKLITNTEEFCETIRAAKPNMHILKVGTEEVDRCKELITSWKPPAVRGIGSAHTIVPVGPILMMRETSCFHNCCYEEGGVFHPTCTGWQKTSLQTHHLEKEGDASFRKGSWLAVRYRKGWYMAQVLSTMEGMYEVSYMTKAKGDTWKWGRKETGMVDQEDVMKEMAKSSVEGKIHTFCQEDILAGKQLSSQH